VPFRGRDGTVAGGRAVLDATVVDAGVLDAAVVDVMVVDVMVLDTGTGGAAAGGVTAVRAAAVDANVGANGDGAVSADAVSDELGSGGRADSVGVVVDGSATALGRPSAGGSRSCPGMSLLMDHLQPLDGHVRVELSGG
jgi:hypothetical protein